MSDGVWEHLRAVEQAMTVHSHLHQSYACEGNWVLREESEVIPGWADEVPGFLTDSSCIFRNEATIQTSDAFISLTFVKVSITI
jgi:hypothetical protein